MFLLIYLFGVATLNLKSTSLWKFKFFLLLHINSHFSTMILIRFHCWATMYYVNFWRLKAVLSSKYLTYFVLWISSSKVYIMLISTLVPKITWNFCRSTSNLNLHSLLFCYFVLVWVFIAFYFIWSFSTQWPNLFTSSAFSSPHL